MKLNVEQIEKEKEEEVRVYCHDAGAVWVQNVREAALGQVSVCGYKDNVLYRLRLSDIYYFEVVEGTSFFIRKKMSLRQKKNCTSLKVSVPEVHCSDVVSQ